ncbi:hypothetical protein [Kitasatospora sp. CMC57]|uniref:Serine/threonine protein kinase n=1 Tax=Kitasatospora sp. CMC57 TaxID=3231513 RepID=A0AB33K601_9ACTN
MPESSAPEPTAEAEPTVEPPADSTVEPPAEVTPEPGDRKLPRAAVVALTVAGLLAVTAASATVTVAIGKPDRKPRTVAAAPTASGSPSPSPSPSATPTPAPAPTPTEVPSPVSTLHGTVNGSTHGGDLRFFLLPMPAGAESYGSADGVKVERDAVKKDFESDSAAEETLDYLGYKEGATRRYRSADGQQEVEVRMLRFKSAADSRKFADGSSYKDAQEIDIDGDAKAKGFMMKPKQEAWTGMLVGVSAVGDVEYEITVLVKGTPDKAPLQDAMKRQRERLNSGG